MEEINEKLKTLIVSSFSVFNRRNYIVMKFSKKIERCEIPPESFPASNLAVLENFVKN